MLCYRPRLLHLHTYLMLRYRPRLLHLHLHTYLMLRYRPRLLHLHTYLMLRYRWVGVGWGGLITFNGTSTHTWCYATGLFSCTCTHSWCYATDLVSCTCTHSWCYATRLFSCTSTHSCARKKPKSPNFLFSPCGETQIHQKTRHPETASFYSWRSQKRAKTSEKWWKNKTQWN